MRPLDVGIVGCGTAGSAAAVFLARAGHRVTVYERVVAPRPVGAGIILQPTGLHVLGRLGLADRVVARGSKLIGLACATKAGRPLLDLSYAAVAEGLFGLGVHRGVLFEALFDTARVEPRVAIKTGLEIVELARTERPSGGRRDPRWTWLVDAKGDRHGPHELVVVADGARSQLRDDTGTSKRITSYPWGALWFVGQETRPEDDPGRSGLRQIVDGNHRFLGLLPTGRPPAADESIFAPSAPALVSLFWSIRGDRVGAFRAAGLDAWKREVLELGSFAAPFLDQIHEDSQILFAAYHDVVMHRWHTRDVVYLGDAAHAMSPQLGQGANLALFDAMELATALASEERDLASALATYSRRREDHLAFYQVATRWLTPLFQGDDPLFATLRDIGMPLMAKIPYFRKMMTLGMLGVIEGFTGRTLPVPL